MFQGKTIDEIITILDDLITQAEAARDRNVSRTAINSLVDSKRIPHYEIGGIKFVRRSDLGLFEKRAPGRKPLIKKAEY